MSRTNNKSKTRKIIFSALGIAAAVLFCACFVITFARDEKIPTWHEIFIKAGLRPSPVTVDGDDYVTFLDVGQGDSALIVSNGQTALIDAGESYNASALYQKLRGYNVNGLDFILGTHIHSDHIGGLPYLLEYLNAGNLMIAFENENKSGDTDILEQIIAIAKERDIKLHAPVRASVINIGDFELTVIGYYPDATGENNHSVVTMARFGESKFLFTGDAEKQTEALLLDDNINVDCDVLKVGHHGSKTSSSAEFLNAATPEYAVISCGKDNRYSHPNAEIVSRLEKCGAQIYRTDISGDIIFAATGNEVIPSTQK